MPTILHESTGLKIVRNDNNRFCVVTLHYTADPVKRTPEWQAEARAGMRAAQWAKEYEIDYTALYGQRVFPEVQTNKSKIVIQEPYPEFPPTQVYLAGFDFGSRNPSSFHVYALHDNVLHAVWELYEPCKTIPDLCAKIRDCPYFRQIRYIICDPTITNQRSRTNKFGAFVTISELMAEEGIKNLIPGNVDETTWIATMRRHWSQEDPTFQIFARCPAMIQEFENAVFAGQSEREALTQTYRENMEDVNNHAMDDCKYVMNFLATRTTLQQREHKEVKMYKWWLH